MREILLLFLVVMTGLQASGQELRKMRLVGDASKSDSEIVTRRDRNGNLTAGIMVISDMDGFSYDSYDGVVGSVDHRPGMDIVYLSTNERVLEIYKSGYQPLKIILSEVGIRLKPQEVWQIKVAGDALPASAIPVTIRLTPADAVLTIDGKPATGTTHSLTPGSHTLKIEKEGFKTEEKTIAVSEQQVFFEFALTRQPDAGLQIETTPAGASVYLDGVKLGETPLAVFYKPGTYPIRIVKEGYVTIEGQTLEVALPQTRKSYTLEENVGYITINTQSGASVYFNDQLIANPKNVKLPPQLVKVKVTQPKAEPLEQQVILKRNERLTFDMFPVVQTGTIQIAVTPFDAQIELTGDAGEKYTATGMKVFEDIPVGTYTAKVSAAGYDTKQESIHLKTGEIVNRSIRLTEIQVAQPTATKSGFKCGTDKLVDTRDGNQYETVQIGNQCWMKENLKWLPSVNPPAEGSITSANYYVYDYKGNSVSSAKATANYRIYGVLYNWPVALKACPTGWHLPSDDEWTVLTNYLGGESVAGGKMKTLGTTHWNSPNASATNSSSFKALPGGYRYTDGSFGNVSYYGYWWSSSPSVASNAWSRCMYYSNAEVFRGSYSKSFGFSVRCLKDN